MSRKEAIEEVGPACTVCGAERHSEELAEFGEDRVCGNCKDTYLQCLREGASPKIAALPADVYRNITTLTAPQDGDLLLDRCCFCGDSTTEIMSIWITTVRIWVFPWPAIKMGICQKHRQNRLISRFFTCALCVWLIVVTTIANSKGLEPWQSLLIAIVPIVPLAMLHRLLIGTNPIQAFGKGDSTVIVSGLGKDYLSLFPEKATKKEGVSS